VGMWESRVLCEISKRRWASFCDVHGRVISTAVRRHHPTRGPCQAGVNRRVSRSMASSSFSSVLALEELSRSSAFARSLPRSRLLSSGFTRITAYPDIEELIADSEGSGDRW
jgi:hypothetical protein